jgi:hypothetical protein
MSLLQDLRNSMPAGLIRPIGVRPVGDKVDRMAALSAKFKAGQVHLAKDAHRHADFLSEMLAFPNGRHDDQVDIVSQLLTWRQNVWMPRQARSLCHLSTREAGNSLGEWLRHHSVRRAECALKLLWVFSDAGMATAWYGSPN